MVIPERLQRLEAGSCCGSGCDFCPYSPKHKKGSTEVQGCTAFDFDSTLVTTGKGEYDPKKYGENIPNTISLLKRHLKAGDEVIIFTARAAGKGDTSGVKKWLKENDLPSLDITATKSPKIALFYDDRACSVKKDKGTTKMASHMIKAAVLGFKALTGNTGPIKAALRQLRKDGVQVRRVIPQNTAAQLPNTQHLPQGTSAYSRGSWDPTTKTFNNSIVDVQKGQARHTMEMTPQGEGFGFKYQNGVQGGTNPSPIASLMHEGGHHWHHKMMRMQGMGDSMGRHQVPGNPALSDVMNELGANNTALKFLQNNGASREAMAYYKGARAPSFHSYTKGMQGSTDPAAQRVLQEGANGFTKNYDTLTLPNMYQGTTKTAAAHPRLIQLIEAAKRTKRMKMDRIGADSRDRFVQGLRLGPESERQLFKFIKNDSYWGAQGVKYPGLKKAEQFLIQGMNKKPPGGMQ